jgi:outer membrane protein assembly factor BamB
MHAVAMIAAAFAMVAAPAVANEKTLDADKQWPQWRGPNATGAAPHADPPITWNETKNVRWKIPIPGKGHATPIIWGDRIFVTTAIAFGDPVQPEHGDAPGAHHNVPPQQRQKFVVLAIDRRNGAVIWQKTVRTELPHEGTHITGTWASNSSVTDGQHLYAYFGSRGLYCMDMDGKVVWQTDLGDMHTRHGHGEGSSPALQGNTIVINWDQEGDSFVIAIDKRTGKERWRVARDEITSWSTPLMVEHDGKVQVVIAATKRVRAYDLADGRVIWECGGLSRNVVASPVAADGFVYVGNSYDSQAMMAIRLTDATGDITGTSAVAWTRNRHTPYVPSLLLYDGRLYFMKHNQGFVTCLDAKTGHPHYGPERLPDIGQVFASPVGAGGSAYIVSRNGSTVVLKHGSQFEIIARNQLDDSFSASPAAVGSELYLRGEKFLYCIARDEKK